MTMESLAAEPLACALALLRFVHVLVSRWRNLSLALRACIDNLKSSCKLSGRKACESFAIRHRKMSSQVMTITKRKKLFRLFVFETPDAQYQFDLKKHFCV